ncbi:MAG: 2-hydroxyacid dehydrogenase, partial [Pseudomonadota bacterium]
MAELLVLSNVSRHVAGRLGEGFNVAYRADIDLAAWLHDNADTVRYIFTDGPTGIADDLLAELPNLEIISNLGVGYDGVNTDIATARGIPVTHTPGVLNEEVATTTVLLYLACWRNFEDELAQARSG